jgi:hypothetical protein
MKDHPEGATVVEETLMHDVNVSGKDCRWTIETEGCVGGASVSVGVRRMQSALPCGVCKRGGPGGLGNDGFLMPAVCGGTE